MSRSPARSVNWQALVLVTNAVIGLLLAVASAAVLLVKMRPPLEAELAKRSLALCRSVAQEASYATTVKETTLAKRTLDALAAERSARVEAAWLVVDGSVLATFQRSDGFPPPPPEPAVAGSFAQQFVTVDAERGLAVECPVEEVGNIPEEGAEAPGRPDVARGATPAGRLRLWVNATEISAAVRQSFTGALVPLGLVIFVAVGLQLFIALFVIRLLNRGMAALRETQDHLIRAREEALEASRAKSRFLANMSHEIRTPLNGVVGMTTLLLDTELTSEQREYLELARGSVGGLLGLINEILDLAKIEAGRLVLESLDFDLHAVVREAVLPFAVAAKTKGLRLVWCIDDDVAPWRTGDPLRLRQVLNNLLGNAMKFTELGAVTVRVVRPEGGDDLVQVIVSDTGIGIPPNFLARLFEPFSQADESNTRRYGGTGLGLNICRQLVELMGGKIEVDSELGKGSTFRFVMKLPEARGVHVATGEAAPRLDESAPAAPSTPGGSVISEAPGDAPGGGGAPSTPRRPRVLLAEDNRVNQLFAMRTLEKLGYEVSVVGDGKRAVTAALEETFDIVLMDVQMPEMDGFEATKCIREVEKQTGRHLPIIAVTAHAMQGDGKRCLEAGMDGYVSKPIDVGELRRRISGALEPPRPSAPR